jgi:hypothetical protein
MGEVIRGWDFVTKQKEYKQFKSYDRGEAVPREFLNFGKHAWFTQDVDVTINLVNGEVHIRPFWDDFEVDPQELFMYQDFWALWDTNDGEFEYFISPVCIGKQPCL